MSSDLDALDIGSCLEHAKFYINDEEIALFDYEKININILSRITIGEKSNNVIIHPGGDLILYMFVISSAITQYLINMKESKNYLAKNLNEDDIVEIDGAHVRYKGISKLGGNGSDNIKLEYADGVMYIDVDKIYRLQPYKGTSIKLSKMPNKHSSKKSKTKDFISNILNIDKTELAGIHRYSTLIILNKQRIFDLISNLKVSIQDNLYSFTSVFPCAYYSGVDKLYNFPGNYTKGDPLIKFVSKVSTAKEIIINNKDNIRSVIVYGEGIYQNCMYELEQIISRKSIHDNTIVLEWSEIKTIRYFLKDEYEFKLYVWNENAILNNVNLSTINYKGNNFTKLQNNLINNYLDKQINIHKVDCRNEFISKITEARKRMKIIADTEVQDEEKDEFIRIAYSLAILFEKSCFPLRNLEKMIDEKQILLSHPISNINRLIYLKERLINKVLTSSFEEDLDKIINNLKEIREIVLDENPKWIKLNKLIQEMQFQHSAIVMPKQYYVNAFESSVDAQRFLKYTDICAISKFKPEIIYDEAVFTGFYEHKNFDIYNNCFAAKMTFLLYPTEIDLFQWKKRQNDKLLRSLEERNMLDIGESKKVNEFEAGQDDNYVFIKDETHTIIDLDQLILDLVKKQTSQLDKNYDLQSGADKVESVKTILFESGEKAFLTKYFKPSVIDRDSENIFDKDIDELCVGDEIVFIKSEVNAERDIIESIINRLMKDERFFNQYGELWELSDYWKRTLKKYMLEKNFSEEYVSVKLLGYGITRDPVTIACWIKSNKIIGPKEEEVYDALALVTEDEYFIKHSKDVYQACSEIRKLYVKLKKQLAKSIIKSVVSEEKSEFDIIVESIIGDLSTLANIVQIEMIFTQTVDVPFYMANKLIED